MDNLHKSPEMLALEQQWRKQKHRPGGTATDTEHAQDAGPEAAPALSTIRDLKVPTLPAATVLLIEMCHDLNVSYPKLSKIIQSDPGLAVRILRVANSAYYAQANTVSSVVRALTVLGLKEIRTIGLSYKLMNVIKDFAHPDFDFESYWEKSLLIAVTAREFARQLPSPMTEEAFLAGLLQDVGIVILRYNKEAEYRKVADVAAACEHTPLIRIEQQMFGTNHAEIGAATCERWHFPKILTHAIRQHHSPPHRISESDPQSQVHAAAYGASLMPDFLQANQPMKIVDELESRGILPSGDLGSILQRGHEAFEAMSSLFDSHLSHDTQVASLMVQASSRLKRVSNAQLNVCQPPE